MKLRSKIHFVIAAIIVFVVAAALLIERTFVLEKFRQVEDTWMAENIRRAENAVADEIAFIDSHAKDWGWWNATYDFILTLDPEYSESNFNPSSLIALKINNIIYLNNDRKIVSSASVDFETGEMVKAPKPLIEGIAAESAFFEPKSFKAGVMGTMIYGDVIYFLSARQILTSNGLGPSHGTIIMVRALDAELIQSWEQLVQRKIEIRRVGDPNLPDEVKATLKNGTSKTKPLIIPQSEKAIDGYAIIRDIRNKPAFVMQVLAPRSVWEYAHAAILYSSISLSVLAILSFGITALILRRDLLAHLAHIDNEEIRRSERKLRRANEELERVNKARIDFTSMVSHELRTPLGTIKQAIEIMLEGIDGPLAEKQANRLEIAKRNVERLVKLTNDILDFSRLETGRIQMEFEDTDLNDILEELHALMKPAADKKGLALRLQLPDTDVHARCDADKIRQTVINLVNNAIKFTDEGGAIDIALSETHEEARIDIADTGLGIDENQIPKLFLPFSQLRGPTYKPGEGSGLGLSICKQIVQAHGGRIELASEQGQGSTFSVFLPKAGPTPASDDSVSLSEGI